MSYIILHALYTTNGYSPIKGSLSCHQSWSMEDSIISSHVSFFSSMKLMYILLKEHDNTKNSCCLYYNNNGFCASKNLRGVVSLANINNIPQRTRCPQNLVARTSKSHFFFTYVLSIENQQGRTCFSYTPIVLRSILTMGLALCH